MNHTNILKRAFTITWRYRPLWIFGFLLALCGGGGSGGGNFNFPSGGGREGDFGDFENIPSMPEIDPNLVITLIVAFVCLILLLSIVGIVVQYVTRTALMGMVRQIEETAAVTGRDGWRFGWSNRAWRIFLLGLLIGLPLTILSIGLILLALSPLLLLILDETASTVLGVVLTIFSCLLVGVLLFIISVIIAPIQEMAWRRIALAERGVVDSLREAVVLIRRRLKDVAIMWLLMVGVGFAWGIVALIVVLPVSLIVAALLGGIPAGLVYLISQSGWGALIAGVPLALLAIIILNSAATGFFLIYQSTVWTLTYLELQKTEASNQMSVISNQTPNNPDLRPLAPDPL
ncbi:MAG: hypothetical protein Fur0044_17530 [Anaerolineae bacterium]